MDIHSQVNVTNLCVHVNMSLLNEFVCIIMDFESNKKNCIQLFFILILVMFKKISMRNEGSLEDNVVLIASCNLMFLKTLHLRILKMAMHWNILNISRISKVVRSVILFAYQLKYSRSKYSNHHQ